MAASPSAFTTKLSTPLRHLLLRQSAISLAGKMAASQTPVVSPPKQKPILGGGGCGVSGGGGMEELRMFRQVEWPAIRTLSQLAVVEGATVSRSGESDVDVDVDYSGSEISDFDDDDGDDDVTDSDYDDFYEP